MNRDDIIRMAREAGLLPHPENIVYQDPMFEGRIKTFAALVADNAIKPWAKQLKIERKKFQELNEISVGAMQAVRLDEREACAKVADDMTLPDWANEQIATAIRARSN